MTKSHITEELSSQPKEYLTYFMHQRHLPRAPVLVTTDPQLEINGIFRKTEIYADR
jgi:hypothetical protein